MDEKKFTEKQAMKALKSGYSKAKSMLNDTDKLENFLQKLEKKLRFIPFAGDKLARIPIMVSLIRNYIKGRYKSIPIGVIIAVLSALIYFFTPLDVIPDIIPGIGYIDDGLVIASCWKLVNSDLEEYIKWREEKGKEK